MTGVLIITGASRGIGAATAKLAAKMGYRVAVNFARDRAGAEQVVEQIGAAAFAVQADVASEQDVVAMFQSVERQHGPISALVNNAGITGGFARADEIAADRVEQMLRVNVLGPMLCAREAVRRMSTRHGGSGGAIVNISSLVSRTGGPGDWVHYAVSPGLIETGIHADNGRPERLRQLAPSIPMHRAGSPEEVAEAVLWLLSPAASYVTGSILEVGGGR
jgi:NAD(P)-dependent dehydrogenase (short-subunit alcohol dehydrogenase family)